MDLALPQAVTTQPPVWEVQCNEINVAIASLSIGGAERIVIDWASRIYPKWIVHLIVLRDRPVEWPVPDFVRVTRLHGKNFTEQLKEIGKVIAQSGNPVCICHLLKKNELSALSEGGAYVIPVLHNAKEGWPEDAISLSNFPQVIAVSNACANDLQESGYKGRVLVVRHIPRRQKLNPSARQYFRMAWNIPQDALVIGMIGAIKQQKNYSRALGILKSLIKEQDAYLVILGGPAANQGRILWETLVSEIHELGLRERVAMPGFIQNAVECLPAFDVIMNTSNFEGLSIATLEALIHGLPVVASNVGGQGEIKHEGLWLIPNDASEAVWVQALFSALKSKPSLPSWINFPAYKLWTLAGLASSSAFSPKALFVTANLNSGGAQRSLVNLSKLLKEKLPFEILVAGNSSAAHFYQELRSSGISVMRAGEVWDAFDFAESLAAKAISEEFGTVCFWNVDARIKLLAVKSLAFTAMKFVDVSPGDSLFDELGALSEFSELVSFTKEEYYERLNTLVLKYDGPRPLECSGKTVVIPNGVFPPGRIKTDYRIHGSPRVAVNGRIAPAKFTIEIIDALRILWAKMPSAQLHFFGAAESFHADYAKEALRYSGTELGKRIFFHGPRFETSDYLPDFDAYVVLGQKQGCPNALLEALAMGLPAIGNDDGGTAEQLLHGYTGLLIKRCDPAELARALIQVLTDRDLARELGINGRRHVLGSFTMEKMSEKYFSILSDI